MDRTRLETFKLRLSFGAQRRMEFYGDLAEYDAAGLPAFTVMRRILEVSRGRKRLKWMADLMTAVLKRAGEGKGVADALAPYLPPEEVAMLAAGERSGNLRAAFAELAGMLRQRVEIQGQVRKVVFFTLSVVVAVMLLLLQIMRTVVPEAKKLVSAEAIERLTIAPWYIGAGEWLLSYWWLLGLLLTLAGGGGAWSLSRWRPSRFRQTLDRRVLPYSFYARMQSSYMLLSVAAMLQSGQQLKSALQGIQQHSPPWLRQHLGRMLRRLAEGRNEVESLMTGLFPEDVEDRLRINALHPEIRKVMQESARASMRFMQQSIERVNAAARFAVMAMVAAFILLTAFTMAEIAMEMRKASSQVQTQQG